MKKTQFKKGFTLVELLVVIAIIAIISGIIITSLQASRLKARDAKRVADVTQIQLAAEQYFDRCGQYPAGIGSAGASPTGISVGCPSGITLATFLSQTPTTPTGGNYDYAYHTLGIVDNYIVHALLEGSNNAAMRDSLASFPSDTSNWSTTFTCSNNVANKDFCAYP